MTLQELQLSLIRASAPRQVMRRYHIQDRDDYKKYNKLCGLVTKLVSVLRRLDAQDPARIELTDQVLSKCAHTCLAVLLPHCKHTQAVSSKLARQV